MQSWEAQYHVRKVLRKDTQITLENVFSAELKKGFVYAGSVDGFMIFANFVNGAPVINKSAKMRLSEEPDGSYIAEVITG